MSIVQANPYENEASMGIRAGVGWRHGHRRQADPPRTGATGGIGRAIARSLAERGGSLAPSLRKAAELEELAASPPGDGHSTAVADLAEPGAALELAATAIAEGPVDVLLANAGLPGSGRLELQRREVSRAVRVNLEAPMLLTHELLPAMIERRSGRLLFVSSLSGKAASPLRASVYNATKFGLRGFALALRDLAGDNAGVGVSLVLPGFIRGAGLFADLGPLLPGMGTSSCEEVSRRRQGDRAEPGRGRGRADPAARDRRLRVSSSWHRRARSARRRHQDRRQARPRPG